MEETAILNFWQVSGMAMWLVLAMSAATKLIEITVDLWRKFYKWRKN